MSEVDAQDDAQGVAPQDIPVEVYAGAMEPMGAVDTVGAEPVAEAPAVPSGMPSFIVTASHLNPRLGVRVATPFTVTLQPYFGGEYVAQAHFFPTHVVAHTAAAALDGLVGVLINRLVRFTLVRDNLPPDLYDEYRALCAHLQFL